MYEGLKNIVRKIVPFDWIKRNEINLRKIIYLLYKGYKKQCTICEKKLRKFIELKNGEKLCPYCGSLGRHRRLWLLLQPLLYSNIRILDFSPPLCLFNKMNQLPNINYCATDYSGEFTAHKQSNITRINEPGNSYNLIICYHILEHIEDDNKAIKELYRVLTPTGKVLIQTPLKEGNTYENPDILSAAERKLHFGQEDHVRIYSLKDLIAKLEKENFIVAVNKYQEEKNNYYGLNETEVVLIAKK